MKIRAMVEVPSDTVACTDDQGAGWFLPCKLLAYRDRTGKKGAPIQRQLPKCTLFNVWLEGEYPHPHKCPACLNAEKVEDET